MKKRKILVISNKYPFGKGENFLQDELETVKDISLYLCPLEKNEKEVTRREIPANITLLLPERNKVCLSKKFSNLVSYFNELKRLWQTKRFNLLTIKKATVAQLMSDIKANKLCNIIKKNRLIEKEEELVLYSYWSVSSALAALKVKKKLGDKIKVVSRAHGIDLYEERHQYNYLPYKEDIYMGLDKIYPISENGKRYIIEKYNISTDKCTVQRLGTHNYGVNKFKTTEELIIVSCSSVIPLKRLDLIIDTLKQIKDIRIKWIHFGEGELLSEIKEKAEKSLKNNIVYEFRGYCEKELIMDFYKEEKIDLFVNVSEYEGIPVSIMEALSFGIPVVAPNIGGISEIVKNHVNGWIIEKDRIIETLRNVIELYFTLSILEKKQIRNNARISWEINCNADINYYSFYNEIQEI